MRGYLKKKKNVKVSSSVVEVEIYYIDTIRRCGSVNYKEIFEFYILQRRPKTQRHLPNVTKK